MNKLLKGIGWFFIGLSIIMLGYCGAYTIDTIYDTFSIIREHESQINNLTIQNKSLIKDISESTNSIYTLMGQLSILRNNSYFFRQDFEREKIKTAKKIRNMKDVLPSYKYLSATSVYIVQQKKYKYLNSIYTIGSGVIVKKDIENTYILTNKHICDETTQDECFIQIFKYNSLLTIPLTFVNQYDGEYDLALWKTKETLPGKKAIKGIKESFPQDKVYSVGNYLAYPEIYTEGTFAGYEQNFALVNMPCAYGCSGSGVFTKDGYLTGLIFAGNKVDSSMDTSKMVLIPYDIIKIFLKDIL